MAGGLEEYSRRRDFSRTPEPKAGTARKSGTAKGGRFVVQKHDARRLHFDLRLELDGVLKSWAVTRGPSLDPADKRLAVHTEDHPLDYATFEGTIPAGAYGGGTMMLWDRGAWTYEGQGAPADGYAAGKIALRLDGERLKGAWTLVRMGGKAAQEKRQNWLLIKADDATARPGEGDALVDEVDTSCATGRTMDAIATGACVPTDIAPQLCSRVDHPPDGPNWLHEIKFDGYRVMIVVENGTARVLTRNGLDWTDRFPPIAEAAARLPVENAVLDGEAVVLDAAGLSSFALLQEAIGRFGNKRGAAGEVRCALFDLLHHDGRDLRGLPLIERKEALRGLISNDGPLFYSDHIDGAGGAAVLRNACGMALEGIISKRRDRPYVSGRGKDWVKSKCVERQEFVIGGFTLPSAKGPGIGAVLLGVYEDGGLVYCGKVGTGFTEASGKAVRDALESRRQDASPFAGFGRKEAGRDAVFVAPEVVCEVEFLTWSRDNLVRQGVFQGLREDKDPHDIRREASGAKQVKGAPKPMPEDDATIAGVPKDDTVAGVRLSSPDKVLYPEMGLSKRGLAEFVAEIGDRLLREVADRPVSLVRCPHGAGKACFYQRHGFKGLPEGVDAIDLGGSKGRTLVVRSVRGLVGLVQLGVLELHPWGARIDRPDRPDRLILDLDPDEGLDFARVKAAAVDVRARLDGAGLRSFLKVTGGKGLHVVVPLSRRQDWAEVKAFGRALAEAMEADAPGSYVASMSKARRKGRIFIDFFRNDRGSTAIAAWSPRARAGAPVAVPLAWDDLPGLAAPNRFTVDSLRRRLAGGWPEDPWAEMADVNQSLTVKARKSVGLK